MEIQLENKVALVTGASSGIGKQIVQTFHDLGAQVILFDVDAARAHDVAAVMGLTDAQGLVVEGDVTNPADSSRAVQQAVAAYGHLDILINSAGISNPMASEDMLPSLWNQIIAVDLSGVFFCSQAAARQMIQQGGGNIVSISSISAALGFPMRAPYCAAKAGVEALTRVLAAEWAAHHIRVNAVAPGYIMTDLVQKNIERGVVNVETVSQRTPLGRLGEPSEIANVIAMLVSDYGSYITGETIYVDGGYTATAASGHSTHG